MIADETTFFLAFAAVFLGIAAYAWSLHRKAAVLQTRIEALEAATANPKPSGKKASKR